MTQEQMLLGRLRSIRRKIQLLFALHGLGRLMIVLPAMILAAVVLDYFLKFPGFIRAAMLVGLVVALLVIIVRHLYRPLSTHFTIEDVAVELEGQFPELDDRLATTVNFLTGTRRGGSGGESETLRQAVIADTLQATGGIRLNRALRPGPLLMIFGLGVLITLAIGSLGLAHPEADIGLTRLLNPFGETQWPKRTFLQVDGFDDQRHSIVRIGDDLEIAVRVVKGAVPKRVFIHFREQGGEFQRELMQPVERSGEDAPLFLRRFTRVRSGFDFYIVGGDDSTRDGGLFTVEAVPAPAIEQVILNITEPRYVQPPQSRTEQGQGRTQLFKGSTVVLDIITNKPLQRDEQGVVASELILKNLARPVVTPAKEDGGLPDIASAEPADERIRLVAVPPDESLPEDAGDDRVLMQSKKLRGCYYRAEFQYDSFGSEPLPFNFDLLCIHGFRNDPVADSEFVPRDDRAPEVSFVQPEQPHMRVTPDSFVDVEILARDDLGLDQQSVELRWRIEPGAGEGSRDLSFVEQTSTVIRGRRRWDLRELTPEVGSVIVYYGVARDHYQWHGRGPHETFGPEYQLEVVSKDALSEALIQEMIAKTRQVSEVIEQQEQVQSQAKNTRAEMEEGKPLSDQQRRQVMNEEVEQQKLRSQAQNLSREFEALRDKFSQHRIEDQAYDHLKRLEKVLDDVSRQSKDPKDSGEMSKATQELRKARESQTSPAEQAAGMDKAIEQQQQAIDKLRDELNKAEQFTEAEKFIQQLMRILRDQHELTEITRALAMRTLGKSPADLTDDERDIQRSIERRQEELSRELAAVVAEMKVAAAKLVESNAAVAAAIQKACDIADNRKPADKMQKAAQNVAQNLTSNAVTLQQGSEEDLIEMISVLADRRGEEIKAQIEALKEIAKELKDVMERQEGHIQDNKDGQQGKEGAKSGKQQASEQSETGEKTGELSEQMKQNDASEAAEAAKAAQQSMSQAASQMSQGQQSQAQESQEEALEQLQDADEKLQQKIDELQQEQQQEKLEKIIDKLARIKNEEVEVNTSTVALDEKVTQNQPWTRRDLGNLVQAQDRQKSALLDTSDILKEVEEDNAKVFSYALRIIADRMDESHQGLMERQTGAITQTAQQRAIAMLSDLVEALEEEKNKDKKKKEDEQQSGGGGGGGGGEGEAKLIPPMAELKMLRIMQTEILQATEKVARDAEEAKTVTAEIEAEARRIGRDQQNVKKLMEELTDPEADQQGVEL